MWYSSERHTACVVRVENAYNLVSEYITQQYTCKKSIKKIWNLLTD